VTFAKRYDPSVNVTSIVRQLLAHDLLVFHGNV
jgi:hypothetical protein